MWIIKWKFEAHAVGLEFVSEAHYNRWWDLDAPFTTPESKQQNMQWKHASSKSPRKFKVQASQLALFSGTLKVYCWLTLCLRKWQLQGFTTLTYSTNCDLPLKRSVQESWPKYTYFCTTMHLLTGPMLDKLLYLNPDFKKCITHHILLTWHRVITSVSKFAATPPWTEIFDRWWAQVCDLRVVEGAVRTVLFHRRWETSTTL